MWVGAWRQRFPEHLTTSPGAAVVINGKVLATLGVELVNKKSGGEAENRSGIVVACQTNIWKGDLPVHEIPESRDNIYPTAHTTVVTPKICWRVVGEIKTMERECPVLDEFEECITVWHFGMPCKLLLKTDG